MADRVSSLERHDLEMHAISSPTPEEVVDQVKRIARSERFKSAGPITKMLLFLGEQAGKGSTAPVKEYQIATEALKRGTDFDPRIDSTVRTLATRLRDRLDVYYMREGQADRVILYLPKGAYALSASYRAPAPIVSSFPAPSEVPAAPSPSKATFEGTGIPRILPYVLGMLLLGTIAIASFLLGRSSTNQAIPKASKSFWSSVLGNQPSLIVYSNPVFSGILEDSIQLEPAEKSSSKPEINIFSGTGEVEAAHLLTHQLDSTNHNSELIRAGLFEWNEALTHNLIFIGGPAQSTPYKQLPQLEKFALKTRTEPPFIAQGAVRDLKPEGNESPYYVETAGIDYGTNGVVYAIIALTPGVSPSHKVLILAGTNTYGTEAAARYVCDPDQIQQLYAKLGTNLSAPLPYFEALVQAEVRGGVPIELHLLAVHKRT